MNKAENGQAEPFAEEAKFFTESRLLQQDVEVVLESYSNSNVVGSLLHPKGNIAELLLREGFARCVDWSITLSYIGANKLRQAEREAKEKKKRIWQNYTPSTAGVSSKDKEYTARVVEVVSADSIMVKLADDTVKKIFLASVRPPRALENKVAQTNTRSSPYDIPFMYEAREFLRKKLIGKKVNITLDFIQPADKNFPQKECCTVTIGSQNIAVALVSKGLATVVRYRQDEDKRSSCYDDLLRAEQTAQKEGVGMHNKKEHSHIRINHFNEANKCKAFLSSFQRVGEQEAVVDYVMGASRFRLLLTRDHSLITFLLAGISCPRSSSAISKTDGEPYGDEAHKFSKELVHQKEVTVVIEAVEKKGCYIGWLFVEGQNLSVKLVREGLAEVHFTGERSKYARQLQDAQQQAIAEKKNKWANYEPVKEVDEVVADVEERKVNYRSVRVSHLEEDLSFYIQSEDDGTKLEEMQQSLRENLTQNPPLPGAYKPRNKDICAAVFPTDSQWYRAQVLRLLPGGEKAQVIFIDYGNKETLSITELAALPDGFSRLPAIARHCHLACIKTYDDGETMDEAWTAMRELTETDLLKMNSEYRANGLDYVTLQRGEEDVGRQLLAQGLVIVDTRKERRLQGLLRDYRAAEDRARQDRLNLWRHGDFTEDDAGEFGYPRY